MKVLLWLWPNNGGKMEEDEDYIRELTAYIHYNEYDFSKKYPTLIVQGDFGSHGYDIDVNTGELSRCCICSSRSSYDCVCGYDEDYGR